EIGCGPGSIAQEIVKLTPDQGPRPVGILDSIHYRHASHFPQRALVVPQQDESLGPDQWSRGGVTGKFRQRGPHSGRVTPRSLEQDELVSEIDESGIQLESVPVR